MPNRQGHEETTVDFGAYNAGYLARVHEAVMGGPGTEKSYTRQWQCRALHIRLQKSHIYRTCEMA